jgi:hypothetical protein
MLVAALCGVARAESQEAGASGVRPAKAAQTDIFVDLVAADFFETDLRLAQSRQIEAATSARYLALDEAGRAQFRAERRRAWRQMSEHEKTALRGVKRPRFDNLDETQKQTFRRIASEELGAAAAGGIRPGEI